MIDLQLARAAVRPCGVVTGCDTRIRILSYLAGGHAAVTAVATALGVSLMTASHHLLVLQRAGILRSEKAGRTVNYWLDPAVCHVTPLDVQVLFAGVTVKIVR